MTPSQLLLLAKIGAVALLFGGVFGMGHHFGENAVQALWDRDKALMMKAEAALVAEHGKEITALKLQQDAKNLKVSDDHEIALQVMQKTYDDSLAAVRASGGLRIPRAICTGSTGTIAQAASNSGHNETPPATVELPDSITANLFSEARRADEIVEQARSCQSWIRSQGFYGVQ